MNAYSRAASIATQLNRYSKGVNHILDYLFEYLMYLFGFIMKRLGIW